MPLLQYSAGCGHLETQRSSQDNQDSFHLQEGNWVKAWNAAAGRPVGSRAGSKPGSPGSGLTWPVTQEDRFSFMEEMSLVPLSLRLSFCGGRQLLREGEAWAAPPNPNPDPPGRGSSLAPEPFPSLTHKAVRLPHLHQQAQHGQGVRRHPHCWAKKQAREYEKRQKPLSQTLVLREGSGLLRFQVWTSHQPWAGPEPRHPGQPQATVTFSVTMWWMNTLPTARSEFC